MISLQKYLEKLFLLRDRNLIVIHTIPRLTAVEQRYNRLNQTGGS